MIPIVDSHKRDSPKNAAAVHNAIARRLHGLRPNPRNGHADPKVPSVPRGAAALLTTVKGIAICSLFPLAHQDDHVIFVIGIRRGQRLPLEEAEYARRWLDELARLGA